MSGVVGGQDFWVAGTYLWVQRDDQGGVVQPLVDLGVMETASPGFTPEQLILKDPRSGLRRVVHETLVDFEEVYEVTVSNLNPINQALLFRAAEPVAVAAPSVQEKSIDHYAHVGRAVKLVDDDTAKTPVYGLAIAGVLKTGAGAPTAHVVDELVLPANEIEIGSPASFAEGEHIILTGKNLTDLDNVGTYTVKSVVSTATTIPVVESLASAQAAGISGELFQEASADDILEPGVDYNVEDEWMGIIKMIDGGAHIANGLVKVYYSKRDLSSGIRLLKPLSFVGNWEGTAFMFWARGNKADLTVRQCRVNLTPNAATFSSEQYSTMGLRFRVLSDLTVAEDQAGLIQMVKGTPPTRF